MAGVKGFFVKVFLFWMLLFLLVSGSGWSAIPGSGTSQTALVLVIKEAIGPAVSDYIQRGFQKAETNKNEIITLQMDTPGGLDVAMRDIFKNILSSPIPVTPYVAPDGSRAASAVTYILYAGHVAAMAPATNLGAATPVQIGGLPGMPEKPSSPQKEDKDKEGSDSKSTLEHKIINDSVAYIKALAKRHGRNAG